MKIKKSELQEMVLKALKDQLSESKISLTEASDFMARREVLNKARDASFKFENEIVKSLGLSDPNQMPPAAQRVFLTIARKMEKEIVKAVAKALIDINRANLPKQSDEKEEKSVDAATAAVGAGAVAANDNSSVPMTKVAESKKVKNNENNI